MQMRRMVLHRRAAWVAVAAAISALVAFEPRSEVMLGVVLATLPVLVYIVVLGVRIRRLRRIIEGDSPLCRERTLGSALAIALVVGLFDVIMAGQGIWSWLLVGSALLYYLPRSLLALRQPPLLKVRLQKGVAVLSVGLAAWLIVHHGRERDQEDALQLVKAVQSYKRSVGRYPADVHALVPAYLPNEPAAARVVFAHGAKYRADATDPTVIYYTFPPFGRRVYSFQSGHWTELD